MPLVPAEMKAQIEAWLDAAHPEFTAAERSSSLEASGCVALLEQEFGRPWLARMARDGSISTLTLLKTKGNESGSVTSRNPIAQFQPDGLGHDVTNLKSFATSLAEVLTSENASVIRERVPELAKEPFWNALAEIRAADLFTRHGCRIAYPVPELDPNGKHKKSVDLTVLAPHGDWVAVEVKRLAFHEGRAWSQNQVAAIRQLRRASEQIHGSNLPGVAMVQLVPDSFPSDEEQLSLQLASVDAMKKWPRTVLAVFTFVYNDDLEDGSPHTVREFWHQIYAGNPLGAGAARDAMLKMITTYTDPKSLSIFGY